MGSSISRIKGAVIHARHVWCVLYTFLSSLTCENIFRILLLRETGAVAYRQQLQCADCLFCAVESVTYEKALLRNTCIHMWGFICAFRMLSAIHMYTQYCILCIVRRVYFHFNARLYFRLFPSLRLCVCSLACLLVLVSVCVCAFSPILFLFVSAISFGLPEIVLVFPYVRSSSFWGRSDFLGLIFIGA